MFGYHHSPEETAEIGLLVSLHRSRAHCWRQIVSDYHDWLVTAACGLLIWTAIASEILWPSDLAGTRIACALLAFIAALATLPVAAAFTSKYEVDRASQQLASLFARYGLRHVVHSPTESTLTTLDPGEPALDTTQYLAAYHSTPAPLGNPSDAELAAGWEPSRQPAELQQNNAGLVSAC